jgi:mRNA-degrading endonuclease toxin of MazEF toxin-antitoxin module
VPSDRPELRRGRIVWAVLRDRHGNAKRRPAVVLTPTADIRDDAPLIVVAVTTTFPDPPPDDCVPLPWHPAGRVLTKLRQRSAAVISWIAEMNADDVLDFAGDVPVKVMMEILKRIERSP